MLILCFPIFWDLSTLHVLNFSSDYKKKEYWLSNYTKFNYLHAIRAEEIIVLKFDCIRKNKSHNHCGTDGVFYFPISEARSEIKPLVLCSEEKILKDVTLID